MTDAREIIATKLTFSDILKQGWAQDIIDALTASGYVILPPDGLQALVRALSRAEDGAGTLPARDSVKLRPADWQTLAAAIRSIGRKT